MTIIPYEKSFASHEKAQFWSDKNELKPNEVFKSSHKKFWFNCVCGHEINITLSNINSGYWCPYCSNQKLCEKNNCNICYEKSFASHNKSVYLSIENNITPRQIFKGSNKRYIFNCNVCNHKFIGVINAITTKDNWCYYCSNHQLCDDNNCKYCYEKSFASHEKAQFWSLKNKDLLRYIFKGSSKKYIFDCLCKHEFISDLDSINNKNTWCPYCYYTPKELCDMETCKQCYEKSFASSKKSRFWSDKNNILARKVLMNSNNKYIFNCECGHEFEISLNKINCNSWCPYCSNPSKKLCNKKDCVQCFNKSFASHEKSKYWSDKNIINIREIFKGSGKKFLFNCEKKHEFTMSIDKVSSGYWCPYCVNKTEQKLYDKLSTLYPTLQQQFKVDWCKNKTYPPFDFVISENKIIIELDGRQHFEQVRNWDDPKKTQENDKYKMKCANDNNYSVIRILQEDVFYDSYDWLSELNNNIKDIIKNKKIQNIYMCKDNEYDIFN